jgi:hypothetical protein
VTPPRIMTKRDDAAPVAAHTQAGSQLYLRVLVGGIARVVTTHSCVAVIPSDLERPHKQAAVDSALTFRPGPERCQNSTDAEKITPQRCSTVIINRSARRKEKKKLVNSITKPARQRT